MMMHSLFRNHTATITVSHALQASTPIIPTRRVAALASHNRSYRNLYQISMSLGASECFTDAGAMCTRLRNQPVITS